MPVITPGDTDAAARQYQALSSAMDSARHRVILVLLTVTAVFYIAGGYLGGFLIKSDTSLRWIIAIPLMLNAQAWTLWATEHFRNYSRPSVDRELAARTSDVFEDLNYLRFALERQSRRQSLVLVFCALQMIAWAFALFFLILQSRTSA